MTAAFPPPPDPSPPANLQLPQDVDAGLIFLFFFYSPSIAQWLVKGWGGGHAANTQSVH